MSLRLAFLVVGLRWLGMAEHAPSTPPTTIYDFPFSARSAICPNKCSGHGVCAYNETLTCDCFPGYTGLDCSLRVCPSSRAWVAVPSANDTAHPAFTECSNMGSCDRTTGQCQCRSGFDGPACDKIICPIGTLTSSIPEGTNVTAVCSGNGRCMSLREVTNFQTYFKYVDYTHYGGWDADKIYGCYCEAGWEGVACEKRSCPVGPDPTRAVNHEVQLIDCRCHGTTCQGGLHISFRNQQTPFIPYDASEELVAFRIRQFTEMESVSVRLVEGDKLCSEQGSVTRIEITLPHGPQPDFSVVAVAGLKSHPAKKIQVIAGGKHSQLNTLIFSQRGAISSVECSDRGRCNYLTGVCRCYDGFRSSDGLGEIGSRGDCGYRYQDHLNYTSNGIQITTNCPFLFGAICSGNGTCNEGKGTCTCNAGYGGSDCSQLSCGLAAAWFGNVDDQHAAQTECGGVGECDGDTGRCKNCGGNWKIFGGERCEYLTCAKGNGQDCSGDGTCLTLHEIGLLRHDERKQHMPVYYDEWDADSIRGCSCARAISIDNQYPVGYSLLISNFFFNETNNATELFTDRDLTRFYRGPFAFSATDFKGYTCDEKSCPKGDNPRFGGVNEIQAINCQADNGSFRLSFRDNVTLPISVNATAREMRTSLEQIFTIGSVGVVITGGENDTVCGIDGNRTVMIEFLTEFGDLPSLTYDLRGISNLHAYIDDYKNSYLMNITEFQKGTKLDVECSGQGVCNGATGRCSCFDGFGSGNGTLGFPGEWGECSFFNKYK
ncbi:hypothetical protein B484DRAFT_356613 [Ochromonadaceae sp. CCMP2298]|nr:hypothetical protein B484DRAFT_356613 [Ochromonadaceae sp. CCMP2298]|mmetsp:Transcript_4295/g.9640  ORF Transcript_4295/g.9640 Transcript_4295/m.9640 type:complete len:772 (-) Transcript_4295:196-2511(-)